MHMITKHEGLWLATTKEAMNPADVIKYDEQILIAHKMKDKKPVLRD